MIVRIITWCHEISKGSFVTKVLLRDVQYSNTFNQDIKLERCCRLVVFRPFYFLFSVTVREQIPGKVDTTASAIGTFFLVMVCFPEVQKEAQTELDNVLNG